MPHDDRISRIKKWEEAFFAEPAHRAGALSEAGLELFESELVFMGQRMTRNARIQHEIEFTLANVTSMYPEADLSSLSSCHFSSGDLVVVKTDCEFEYRGKRGRVTRYDEFQFRSGMVVSEESGNSYEQVKSRIDQGRY